MATKQKTRAKTTGRTAKPHEAKPKIQIKRWTDGAVIYESNAATIKDALCDARDANVCLDGASLDGARLAGARLAGARLDGASLDYARLDYARLDYASLDGASLDGASLAGARLAGARLDGARLDGASLDGASLDGASLVGASLVGASLDGASLAGARLAGARLDGASLDGASPTTLLLASWGEVSDDLCRDLMRLDASAHPDPAAFDRWASGGPCPYNGINVRRVAHFHERRALWSPGPPPPIFSLVCRLLAEKGCKWPWDKDGRPTTAR